MTSIIVPVPNGISRGFGNGHNGIDYLSPVGTPVKAAASGTVAFEGQGKDHSWITWMGGISILLKHDNIYTGYAHLSRTIVNKGQAVQQGQVIGYTGSTGNSTGPHLHFEVLPITPNFNNGYSGRISPDPYFAQPSKGGDMPIPNQDNYYWRYGQKLSMRLRGRELSRAEFVKFLVGQSDLRAIEILSDDPEADRAQQWQDVGKLAVKDNWQGQIYDLQGSVKTLTKQLKDAIDNSKPTDQAAVDKALKEAQEVLDAIKALKK